MTTKQEIKQELDQIINKLSMADQKRHRELVREPERLPS